MLRWMLLYCMLKVLVDLRRSQTDEYLPNNSVWNNNRMYELELALDTPDIICRVLIPGKKNRVGGKCRPAKLSERLSEPDVVSKNGPWKGSGR